jgi:hypothetical protein
MLAEGLLGVQAYAGVTPRLDRVVTQTVSRRGDTGWIPGHVRFVVGKVVLGQTSVINLAPPPGQYHSTSAP